MSRPALPRPGRAPGVLLLTALLVLTGCTTFTDLHPRFKAQSASIRGLAISTDVLILEDVKGPAPLVDIPRLTALAASLNRFLQTGLEERGYRIAAAEHAAIGLRFATAETPPLKVRTAATPADTPPESLATATAPFFLAPAYEAAPRRAALQNAFEDLWRHQVKVGAANRVSRHVRDLGPAEGATHRVFVLVEGVQVPVGKGLKQALATGLLTLGTATAFEMTTVTFRVGIADIASGEFILIADCGLAGGWKVDEAYLRRQAGLFLTQLDHLRK